MDRVPERLELHEQRPGFIIFTPQEASGLLAIVLFALVAMDLARALFRWMFS